MSTILAQDNPWAQAQLLAAHHPPEVFISPSDQQLPSTRTLGLIAPNPLIYARAAEELEAWGFLAEPMTMTSETRWERLPQVSVDEIQRHREQYLIIDVREPFEWRSGQIPQVLSCPLSSLATRCGDIVSQAQSKGQSVAIVCATGRRSGLAAWTGRRMGWDALLNVTGGMLRWFFSGYPTTIPSVS